MSYNKTTISNEPILATAPAQRIPDFQQIRPLHKYLKMVNPPKQAYGFKQPPIYPKVTRAIGSETYTPIAMMRAQGACRYGQASRKQAPLFRDPNIRLRYPRLERDVATNILVPPSMYGEYSQHFSSALVL